MNLLGCLDAHLRQILSDDADVSCFSTDDLAKTRNVKIGFVFQTFNLLPDNRDTKRRTASEMTSPRNQRRQKRKQS
jgi:ABC-type lipoprotein export system ATPase subunit